MSAASTIDNRKSPIGNSRAPNPESRVPDSPCHVPNPLAGLWAEFRKLPAEMRGDAARYSWSGDMLGRVVTSWKTLTPGQIKKLIRAAREESGAGREYRAVLIARMACDLWQSNWDAILRDRLQTRFHVSTLNALSPSQAKAMMGEIVSCISRRDGVSLAEVRAKFSPQRHRDIEKRATDRMDSTDQQAEPGGAAAVAQGSLSSPAAVMQAHSPDTSESVEEIELCF